MDSLKLSTNQYNTVVKQQGVTRSLEIKWEENRGKILAELTMNRTKKNTGDAKHKNKGRGSLRTGPHALINILWLPIFYSPILN